MKRIDAYLLFLLTVGLFFHYLQIIPANVDTYFLIALSIVGTVPILISAFAALRNRKISVDLLASIALVASLLTREWASAAFINIMLTSARLFGYYTDNKSRAAIKSLLKLRPEMVNVKRGDKVVSVPVAEVALGDIVMVDSGDRIAVDGIIEEGEASIDQSSLTGESVPVNKTKGDEVYSSTLAMSGSLLVRTTKVGKDTTLEKIIAMVESSQNEKASIRTTADIFASWYIGIVLIGSVSVFIVFHDPKLLLALLLVACADDIAVAIPMAFLAAIGYAARRGVVIKGSSYLEAISKMKTLVLDKTGTITQGQLAVERVIPLNGFSEHELLAIAGVAEASSKHPIARSIVRYIAQKKVVFGEPDGFEEYPGKGTAATLKGKIIVSGKIVFLRERGVQLSPIDIRSVEEAEERGLTITLFACDGKLAGFIESADIVRSHVKPAIEKLKKLGVERIVMLTGDNERVAKKIADEVGITEYHSGFLPQDKLKYIRDNISSERKLVMVGDGVNDAASLALADVGVAMGAIGSDAAIEASDIALMKDSFAEIPETMELGLYVRRIARQDFIIWGATNAIGLFLVFARIIGPEGASAFNFITDFFPLMNSLRLFNLHLKLK